jgi:hypothetical protein
MINFINKERFNFGKACLRLAPAVGAGFPGGVPAATHR